MIGIGDPAAVTAGVGIATVIMIALGIRSMHEARKRHDEEKAKHDATLEALRALIERMSAT